MLQDSNNCSEKCISGSLVVYPKIPALVILKKISVTLGSSAQNDMRHPAVLGQQNGHLAFSSSHSHSRSKITRGYVSKAKL
jgi:hypothetical protein